jgi:hypothetical protein
MGQFHVVTRDAAGHRRVLFTSDSEVRARRQADALADYMDGAIWVEPARLQERTYQKPVNETAAASEV